MLLITELYIPDKNDEDFKYDFKNVLFPIEFIRKTNNFDHQFVCLKVILLINTNKQKQFNSYLFQELNSYLNHFRL